jgi:hypothetical protein
MWKAFNSLFPLNTLLSEILPPAGQQGGVANSAMFPNLRGGCEWLEAAIGMVGGRPKTLSESWRAEPNLDGPHPKAMEV